MQRSLSLLLRCLLILGLWLNGMTVAHAGVQRLAASPAGARLADAGPVPSPSRMALPAAASPATVHALPSFPPAGAAPCHHPDPASGPVGPAAGSPPDRSAPPWQAGHAQPAHDHHGAATAAGMACSAQAGDADPAHGCCKGGVCACTCAAPAVAGAVYLPAAVPATHDLIVALFDYQPSHLLPQPYRPPIA